MKSCEWKYDSERWLTTAKYMQNMITVTQLSQQQ